MYVALPAANIYTKQDRVCGHKFTPCSRDELRKLQELVPRLRELGVRGVVCGEVDEQSGEALGRRLNVPVETWKSLNRWNWGKLHGAQAARVQKSPEADPSVPTPGGDSWASFRKRMAASRERLREMGGWLLLADSDVLDALAGAGAAKRYRVYDVELKHGEPDAAKAVSA